MTSPTRTRCLAPGTFLSIFASAIVAAAGPPRPTRPPAGTFPPILRQCDGRRGSTAEPDAAPAKNLQAGNADLVGRDGGGTFGDTPSPGLGGNPGGVIGAACATATASGEPSPV